MTAYVNHVLILTPSGQHGNIQGRVTTLNHVICNSPKVQRWFYHIQTHKMHILNWISTQQNQQKQRHGMMRENHALRIYKVLDHWKETNPNLVV